MASVVNVDAEQLTLRKVWDEEMRRTNLPVKYDKVSVFMLSWDPNDDDLGVSDEVNKLARVLRDKEYYNFTVVTRSLNTLKSPEHQALKHLSEFILDEDSERTLLIIYYAGHGYAEDEDSTTLRLSGKIPGPYISWPIVERAIQNTKADVCGIFDCCHAGILGRPAFRDSMRSFQYLLACEAHDRTRSPSPESFTAALTWAFKELGAEKPRGFHMSDLIAKIKAAPKFPRDQYPVLYSARFDSTGQDIFLGAMPREGGPGTQAEGEYRDERDERMKAHTFVDLRFGFEKPVTEDDLRLVAQKIRGWISDNHDRLSCGDVSFLRSVSHKKERITARWFAAAEAVRQIASSHVSPVTPDVTFPGLRLGPNVPGLASECAPLIRVSGKQTESNKTVGQEWAEYGVKYHLNAAFRRMWADLGFALHRLWQQVWGVAFFTRVMDDVKRASG